MKWEQYCEATEYLKSRIAFRPEAGVVFGSGLQLPEPLESEVSIPYSDVPHMPAATAPGHAGRFTAGFFHGTPVLCMHGRLHAYEGYPLERVVFPIRLMKLLGIGILILTNAAGAVNENYHPGEWMLIRDHVNSLGDNPLVGANEERFGPRFPSMSNIYPAPIRECVKKTAAEKKIPLHEGIYFAVKGPSYETPAEVRALRVLGADAVGMSTVPEAIAAAHCGMAVAGFSLLTNMAAGMTARPLSHSEVLREGSNKGEELKELILAALSAGKTE